METPTPTPLLIAERAGRLWLYERTNVRRPATRDLPADMVWLRLLGECDADGNVIDDGLAGGSLTPVTPYQADQMRVVRPSVRRAA